MAKKRKKSTKRKAASSSTSAALRVSLLKKHLRLPHGYTIVKRKK